MINKRIHYKSKLISNLTIFLLYYLISTVVIISGISGSVINIIPFPFTVVIIYLVIQRREHDRARKYIMEKYPERWNFVKAHVMGPYIHIYKLKNTNKNNDEAINEIIKELEIVSFFPVLIFLYFIYIVLL